MVWEPDVDAMPLPHHWIDHNASVSGHLAVFFCRDVASGCQNFDNKLITRSRQMDVCFEFLSVFSFVVWRSAGSVGLYDY
jgi:hypothetical protein